MLTAQQLNQYLGEIFPQSRHLKVEKSSHQQLSVRLNVKTEHLRPGGTVSGPTLFAVADFALYAAILAEHGEIALAVTTNMNINFFSKPQSDLDIIGVCQLLKVGKRLVVGEVSIYSDGSDQVVAHAVGTYSVPPQ